MSPIPKRYLTNVYVDRLPIKRVQDLGIAYDSLKVFLESDGYCLITDNAFLSPNGETFRLQKSREGDKAVLLLQITSADETIVERARKSIEPYIVGRKQPQQSEPASPRFAHNI